MKQKVLISFSGGRTSAFMTWWLLKHKQAEFEMIVVFANTGMEREETLQFVKMCDENLGFNTHWIETVTNPIMGKGVSFNEVDFYDANRDGLPFEGVIAKHGIPNMTFPHCSRELKSSTIRNFAKQYGWKRKDYLTAIGIRTDEPKRLDWVKAKKERLYYPLATEISTTRHDINRFWLSQGFDLQLKSYEGNCTLCWKKSLRKLMTISNENPELTEWWRKMEDRYEMFVPDSRIDTQKEQPPIRFYKDYMKIDDILEEAKLPFEKARDESKDVQYSMWDEHLDSNGGCVQSCEAF